MLNFLPKMISLNFYLAICSFYYTCICSYLHNVALKNDSTFHVHQCSRLETTTVLLECIDLN